MPQFKSARFAHPKAMPVDGRAVYVNDTAAIAVAPLVNDTIDFPLPAGLEISSLKLWSSDMDTGTTMAVSVGFAPVNPASTLAANATYFVPTGTAFGRTAGGITPAFAPITFQEPVFLRVTVTAAATGFAAGTVACSVGGNANGPR